MSLLKISAISFLSIATGVSVSAAIAHGVTPRAPDPYIYAPAPTITYDWSGIYTGGDVGVAHGQSKLTPDGILNAACFPLCPPLTTFTTERFEQTSTRFAGGGFVGLQKQWS